MQILPDLYRFVMTRRLGPTYPAEKVEVRKMLRQQLDEVKKRRILCSTRASATFWESTFPLSQPLWASSAGPSLLPPLATPADSALCHSARIHRTCCGATSSGFAVSRPGPLR